MMSCTISSKMTIYGSIQYKRTSLLCVRVLNKSLSQITHIHTQRYAGSIDYIYIYIAYFPCSQIYDYRSSFTILTSNGRLSNRFPCIFFRINVRFSLAAYLLLPHDLVYIDGYYYYYIVNSSSLLLLFVLVMLMVMEK